ncbi:hypothetical protein [Anaerobium acetethylicum]|uniref:Uncharacterized protein n=1 Tax=Anaerobium acetethylicum TaxID=1619234 RepID=A0A1D3TZF9_9FIRM|nr:hypothetical protein [Anaerobium acetethylicum]SCP99956.1 hypothetical protein SAMN05421730_10775 [Anaerobium acetethylicum]
MGVNFKELKNLVKEYLENKTHFSVEDIEDKAFEYYEKGKISAAQYKTVLCKTYTL